MKMLNWEAFYILSGNITEILLIHVGHSCYILSTFKAHAKHFNCIFWNSWTLLMYVGLRVEVQVNVMRWEQRGAGECDAMGATRWD